MQFLESVLPKEAMEHVGKIQHAVESFYEQAKEQYLLLQDQAKTYIESEHSLVPEHLRPLALKIVDALPETLFAASLISNVGTEIGAIFWSVRAFQVITPMVQSLIQGEVDKTKFEEAAATSWAVVEENVEKAKPAIVVTCSVAAVVHGVMGVVAMNFEYVVRASIFALAAHMAYQSIGGSTAQINSKTPSSPQIPSGTSAGFEIDGRTTAL